MLRRLWTERTVDAAVDDEVITGAGLLPSPIQRPIPVWVGGSSEPAYRRIGRLADGWFPQVRPGDDLDRALATIAAAADRAGRDPSTIGMEGRVTWDEADPDRFARQVERWRTAGATHLGINTMGTGQQSVDDHIAALTRIADLTGVRG